MQVIDMYERGVRPSISKLVFSPAARFLKLYLLRQGFRDGVAGFGAMQTALLDTPPAVSVALDWLLESQFTAEEWVVYNTSMMMWSPANRERFPQPGSYANHYLTYPISRAEGQRRFAEDNDFMVSSKGNDHPFHIHINPIWVMRIDVPDENGELHNVLPEPMWMDTVAIPRSGGRVVFRTRFDDFVGKWVNHCHVLMHEDNGMMQEVECTDDPSRVNYRTRTKVASPNMPATEVDAIYPKPSLELMYRQNLSFVDMYDGEKFEYPGFELEIPKLEG